MRKLWILCLMMSLVAMTSFAQTSKKTTDKKASSTSADTKASTSKGSSDKAAPKADTAKTSEKKESGLDKGATATGKIDVNSASQDELEKLNGIGPVTAKKIVDGRPYRTKRDLLTKKVVSQGEYDKIKDNIIAHQTGDATSAKSEMKATTTKKK
jgi:competence protein ComEA